MTPPPDDSLRTRASLLGRLRDLDDDRSWTEFYNLYERIVRGLARKRGLTEAEAEEVAQEVFKRIAETIQNFEPSPRPGAFRRWLFQLARWRADDKHRERGRLTVEPLAADSASTHSTNRGDRLAAPNDYDEQLEADARRHLVRAALRRLQNRISGRDSQIFQLLELDEWPVTKVAKFFDIKESHVYVVRSRVRELLRSEVARLRDRLDSEGLPPPPPDESRGN